MNLKELFIHHLEKNLPKVESFHPFFNEALALMLKAGGKHFRAQLLLSVVQSNKPELLNQALDVALALEFIHTYSLIHDDLPAMDNADFRRGIPTLHKSYDETTAILVGDALNTEAFLVLSHAHLKDEIKIKLIKTLAFNAGLNGMVIGQAIDCFFEDKRLSLNELEFLHNKPELLNQALDVALALEFIHTYSLIHDDLPAMDNADFRRGIPTLHKSYDETTAILVGDALNTEAFLVLSHAHLKDEIKIKLIKTLAFNAGLNGMVIGQAIDCFFEDKRLSLNELEFLHTHKTAKLIAAALKMGCEICELNNEESNQIYKLGLKLGLIFQINDDIIDVTTSQEQSGKPTNNDIHKNSFVNLLGLEQAIKTKENLLSECEQDLEKLNEKLAQMIQNLIIQYL